MGNYWQEGKVQKQGIPERTPQEARGLHSPFYDPLKSFPKQSKHESLLDYYMLNENSGASSRVKN